MGLWEQPWSFGLPGFRLRTLRLTFKTFEITNVSNDCSSGHTSFDVFQSIVQLLWRSGRAATFMDASQLFSFLVGLRVWCKLLRTSIGAKGVCSHWMTYWHSFRWWFCSSASWWFAGLNYPLHLSLCSSFLIPTSVGILGRISCMQPAGLCLLVAFLILCRKLYLLYSVF